MTSTRRTFTALAGAGLLAASLGLAGCEEEQGTAERIGEKIDETVEQAGDKVEQAGDKVEEAGEQLGEAAEEAADEAEQATDR